jgi:hypothetical protein
MFFLGVLLLLLGLARAQQEFKFVDVAYRREPAAPYERNPSGLLLDHYDIGVGLF